MALSFPDCINDCSGIQRDVQATVCHIIFRRLTPFSGVVVVVVVIQANYPFCRHVGQHRMLNSNVLPTLVVTTIEIDLKRADRPFVLLSEERVPELSNAIVRSVRYSDNLN